VNPKKKKKKTKNQKKSRPVVSCWVGVVQWAEATKSHEVERDWLDGGRQHCLVVVNATWWERGEGKNLRERERWGQMKIWGRNEVIVLNFFFKKKKTG